MTIVRRRLFWKVYLTLLASLLAAVGVLSAVFWFLGEAQREAGSTAPWPAAVTQYSADGQEIAARGRPLSIAEREAAPRRGPDHVSRIELPGGGFVLTRLGPSRSTRALHFVVLLLVVVSAVGLAAYPVTARLTRRLEALRAGVALWGEGRAPPQLDERGDDEVALLARAFNATAGRLDALLASQRALLANASHELRSPLARLRVAVEMARDEAPASRGEIVRNLAEMDGLVDELLLSSRLDHLDPRADRWEPVDLLGLAAEEAARYDAVVTGDPVEIVGDAVLLRRLVRNLLDNGARHGRPPICVVVSREGGGATLLVEDAGGGVAAADRDRIFEPFYRPTGSSERTGGWGLGLALVRQIAERHGGDARCVAALGGGSRFVIRLMGRTAMRDSASAGTARGLQSASHQSVAPG